MEIRQDWLDLVKEEVLEPERPIVDPHHHFFEQTKLFPNYRIEDLWDDTGAGHNVVETVFVQCGEHYREGGPEALAPVGETEWVHGLAQRMAREGAGKAQVGAIVGTANLLLGSAVREVLEAHLDASPLFRGIRDITAWDEAPEIHAGAATGRPDIYADKRFREGFAELAPLGLSYDAYHYHPQTYLLTDLARAFPDTTIVLDHLGTPLGIGPYAGRREEIFAQWKADLADLARCPNVNIKLGGMAMPWNGFGWERRDRPVSSDEFVAEQGRYYHHAIEVFGPQRCMFESNFPVDKMSLSYPVLWNAFKKLAAGCSEDEKDAMFRTTATRVYRIEPLSG